MWKPTTTQAIPERVVPSGEKAGRKFLSTGERAPGYGLSPDHFQKFNQMPAPDWAQKMLCIIVPNWRTHLLSSFSVFVHEGYLDQGIHGLSGSCSKEINAVRKLSVWYKIPIWFQNTVCPKTKDAFPKIQASANNRYRACIGHVLRKYIYGELLKDTTTETSHEKVNSYFFSLYRDYPNSLTIFQMQANSFGAEFLSTISKFMKRMNFVIACLRPSQNVKLGIFTGSRAVDGKEMYKKAWCTCKVVLPCQA